ncbi:hypothetical protein QJS10_CPA01g02313 [Acorus calamus]|uniref:TIR domain-containing protein n=1 Tax=Acorus calamus TaxID=4465 RepID=A0AAV9DSJ8_ACOCL|nr:hypothetical protein QJS10_CPB11g00931 [Acorus calamus]KAK1324413.1 hypothetical protein QJS10_CPA01g02313 [Acorus calamus]
MNPGDKMLETIDGAIAHCKVAVAIFSPRYCESYFCLHELSLMVETNKKIIPIFCDIKPSDLLLEDFKNFPPNEVERFRRALREARYTVGLSYNSLNGNWSDLITNASDIIIKNVWQEGPQI